MTLCNMHPLQHSADVVACNRNPDNSDVHGLDTYNEQNAYNNKVNKNQNNVVPFSANYSNGRIMCR